MVIILSSFLYSVDLFLVHLCYVLWINEKKILQVAYALNRTIFIYQFSLQMCPSSPFSFTNLQMFSLFSRLPVPPLSRSAPSPWGAPQPGTASLLNFAFLIEPFHLRLFSP